MELKAFIVLIVSALLVERTTLAAMITLLNSHPYNIFPGTLTGSCGPQLEVTGFVLETDSSYSIQVNPQWGGRIWAWTGCSTDATGKFSGETADCGTGSVICNGRGPFLPATLAEFALFPPESILKERSGSIASRLSVTYSTRT